VKVSGAAKLAKQLRDMPEAVNANLKKSVRLNTEQAASMARKLDFHEIRRRWPNWIS
jgi:hypothetical protein